MIALSLLVVLGTSAAMPPKRPDALFQAARVLMKQGHYAAACPLLEESQRLEPALGTLLNLAECDEKRGKLARAYLAFNEAVGWAHRNREAFRENLARSRSERLKARLSWVALSTSAPIAGLTVEVNGLPVSLERSAQSVPVDPGEATLVTRAPGFAASEMKVMVAAGQSLSVQLPSPTADTAPVALVDVPKAEPLSLLPSHATTDSTNLVAKEPRRSVAPVITLASGATLMVAGGVGLAHSFSTFERMKRQQPGGPDELRPTVTQGQFQQLRWMYPASWIATAAGALALTGGAIWSAKQGSPLRASVVVIPTDSGVMVPVSGSF